MLTPGIDTLGAALLAGGMASRYGGRPKGLLEIAPGLSILQHLVDQLRLAGLSEIVVLANDPEPYLHLDLPILPDLRRGCGPLAGMEAALSYYYARRRAATLFLPCDLPGITAGEITRLAEAFLATDAQVATCATEASLQPLCAAVDNRLLPRVSAALNFGEGSPWRLWSHLKALEVPFADAAPFFNINQPEDLADWLTRREQSGSRRADCVPDPA